MTLIDDLFHAAPEAAWTFAVLFSCVFKKNAKLRFTDVSDDHAVGCAHPYMRSALFWGFFMAAHFLGDAGNSTAALTPRDYAILSTMIVALLGLGLALKWERIGATTTLLAVAIGAVFNWKVLLFPATLIPIAAVLFLAYSCLRNTKRRHHAAAIP